MKINFKKINSKAIIPSRATSESAGLDICACLDKSVTVYCNCTEMIHTGLSASLSDTDGQPYMLMICARSGLATKNGINLANGVGIIDSDYRGELIVALHNQGDYPFVVNHGMRIAQLIAVPIAIPDVCEVDTLDSTDRGDGGFGSTGI